MKWRPVHEFHTYLMDARLYGSCEVILVTCKTKTGQRCVQAVTCNHGFLLKRPPGRVIAWAPLPEPYQGKLIDEQST